MNKLVTKLQNIPISQFPVKGIKIPNKAKTFDFSKVLHDGEIIDILTFKNKDNLVKRFIFEGDTVTERSYIPLKKSFVLWDEFLKVTGRKISTIVKVNGEYAEKSEEIQTVTHRENENPVVHISKIQASPLPGNIESESQSIYQYETGKPRRGYEICGYAKGRNGYVRLMNPLVNFENLTDEETKILKQSQYVPLHLYSFKQFKKIAPYCAAHPKHQGKIPLRPIRWCKDDAKNLGSYDGKIIRLNEKALLNRSDVINDAAHEREHVYQYYEASKYALGMQTENPEEAEKYYENFNNYINSEENGKDYLGQFIETKARLAGSLAQKEYEKSVENLRDIFPLAPVYLIN